MPCDFLGARAPLRGAPCAEPPRGGVKSAPWPRSRATLLPCLQAPQIIPMFKYFPPRVDSQIQILSLSALVSEGDQCRFFNLIAKKNKKSPFFFSGPSARKSRGSKNREKKSFFGLKNVKNFESGIQFFFLKIISTHQCGRKGTLH